MSQGQVDEHLVIRVGALGRIGGSVRRVDDLHPIIKSCQCFSHRDAVVSHPANQPWVAQHALKFLAHGDGGNPAPSTLRQGVLKDSGSGITENQQIERDVGVDDDRCPHVQAPRGSRAEPCTMENLSRRHSIGPLNKGTRRVAFRRILEGNAVSGVSTQAVQPA